MMYRYILILIISLVCLCQANTVGVKSSFTDSKYELSSSYFLNKKLNLHLRLLDFHQSDFEAASAGFTFPVYKSNHLSLKSSFHYGPSLNKKNKTFLNFYSSLYYTFNELDLSGLYNYYQISSIVHKLKLRSSIPLYYSKILKLFYEIEFKRSKGKTTYETQPIFQYKYNDVLIEIGSNLNSNYHLLFKYHF